MGGCLRDFRNKPFPVRIKAEYYHRTLTVYYHGGMSADLSQYEICTQVDNVDLPLGGFFGISAETGGLADDHDALSFLTHSLITPQQQQQDNNIVTSEEQKKYDKEYEEFLRQLELEKDKYNKEHPEKEREKAVEEEKLEEETQREFRQILSVQTAMHTSIRSLDSKLAEMLGRQEHIVTMLSSSSASQPHQQQQQQQQQQQFIDTFRLSLLHFLFW